MKHKFCIVLMFAVVLLLAGFLTPGTALAAGNDNNVEWDGAGHAPGMNICGLETLNYRYPVANPSTTQSVIVRARSFQFDLTGMTLYYTTNPGASVIGDWTLVAVSWETNCGSGFDSWKATIPAKANQVWYKFAFTDGSDTDWVRTSGEGVTAVSEDEGGWATSSTTLTYTPQSVPTIVYVDNDYNSSTPGWGYDHFATIQNGINTVAVNGTVNVAAGTYPERLTINKSLDLLGAGPGADPSLHTILDGTTLGAGASGIQISSGTTDVTIESLAVVNYTLSSTNYAGISAAGNNHNLTAQHLWVKNNSAGRGGLYLNGPVDNVLINDVQAHYNVGRGIVIWNGFKTNITITNNDVQYNNCCGIELQDGTASGVTISNNVVMNNTDSGIAAVGLTSGAGANLISDNTLVNNGRFGIEIKLPDGTGFDTGDGSIVVEDNVVSLTVSPTDLRDYAGIAAFRRSYVVGNNNVDIPTGVIIRNNTVAGYRQTNASSFSDGFGILVEGTNMTVTGNSLDDNDVGVQLQAGHLPYTPNTNIDGNQNNLDDDYFGRGNSPVGCAAISGNAFDSNTVDSRRVGSVGGGTVTNLDTGEMFCTIQSAIDDTNTLAGHTILVGNGTYVENVLVNKSVEIVGESRTGVIVQPALLNPDCRTGGGGSICGGLASNLFFVQAHNVIIHDMTLDGNNPDLTSAVVCGGSDIDARNGIIQNHAAGVFNNLEVYNTTVQNVYLRGIYNSSGGSGFNFHDNTVENVQCEYASIGIFNYAGSGIIANNTVNLANDAISANWSKGTQFLNNTVTNSSSGVHTDNAGAYAGSVADLIQGNTVTCDGLSANPYGIWTFVTYLPPMVVQNTVTNCGIGLSAWGEANPVVTQFTNNIVTGPTGITGTVGAYITTDLISWGYADVSVNLTGNVISGFDTAVFLTADQQAWNPEPFVPMTITAALFNNSITGYNVGLDLGTLGTYNVNASANWWGTNDPAAVKAAVNGGVLVDYTPWHESGVDTSTDPGFQGDFAALWVDDDSPQTGALGRIQEGVNLALAGGTVNVVAGTYTEQVTITKNLSLLGEDQATTFIQAFASMPSCFTTNAGNHPIICVKDAVATIDGFTIDGLGLGNSNHKFEGVAFRNAGGTLQNSTIVDIRDTPFSGVQHGVAVYAYNVDTTTYTLHVLDNTITGFQKNAMALNSGDTTSLVVDVQRNVITGAGTTTVTAQNGIQVWSNLGTGLIAENTISGIAYNGTGWVASSILNYYTEVDITGNTITDAHTGIYNYDGAGLIANNDLSIIKTGGYAYGILATDPPQAVPSPYDSPTRPASTTLDGMGTNAILNIEVSGNVLTFSGADKLYSSGIEADGGYGTDDMNVSVHDNSVNGFDYGLTFYQCASGCSTGVFTAISAVSNELLNNTIGVYLGGPIPSTVIPEIHHNRIFGNVATDDGVVSDLANLITAENNWFGCNEGPADATCVGVTGLVDADPWLVLSTVPDPAIVQPGGTSLVTSNLIFNSDGTDTSVDGYIPDGTPLAFTAPDGGTIDPTSATTLLGTGSTTFSAPVADQDYQVCTQVDNELLCVFVTVANVAPVAVSDTYTTVEDTQLLVSAPGVLTNDSDANVDTLTAVLDATTPNGTLTLNTDGSFTYLPDENFFGTDSFTYHANDGLLDSSIVTVSIDVTPVNDAPLAFDQSVTTPEDMAVAVTLAAEDVDGDTLAWSIIAGPSNGTLSGTAPALTYTPDQDYFGPDSFTFQVNDGILDSNIAEVTIVVTPVNDLPVAADDTYNTEEDTLLTVSAPGVLTNDSDIEGDALTAVLVADAANGTLTFNADGSFTYMPDAGFNGTDGFTYVANDGTSNSNVATVVIEVGPINDAPVAVDDAYSMNEDTVLSISAPGVLANDTDADGDTLTVTLVADVSAGTLVFNSDGSFTYTPDADFFGEVTFTYVANDGMVASNLVTVTITVVDVPDEPAMQYIMIPLVYKHTP